MPQITDTTQSSLFVFDEFLILLAGIILIATYSSAHPLVQSFIKSRDGDKKKDDDHDRDDPSHPHFSPQSPLPEFFINRLSPSFDHTLVRWLDVLSAFISVVTVFMMIQSMAGNYINYVSSKPLPFHPVQNSTYSAASGLFKGKGWDSALSTRPTILMIAFVTAIMEMAGLPVYILRSSLRPYQWYLKAVISCVSTIIMSIARRHDVIICAILIIISRAADAPIRRHFLAGHRRITSFVALFSILLMSVAFSASLTYESKMSSIGSLSHVMLIARALLLSEYVSW